VAPVGWVFLERQAVETGVEDYYRCLQMAPERAAQIRDSVLAELAVEREQATAEKDRAAQRLVALKHERKAVLQAHYAGALPLDLHKEEMDRLTREMAEAERLAKDAAKTIDELDTTLRQALTVASSCHRHYLGVPPHIRRQINQGFFTKLFIDQDGSVERAELTEPFATLMGDTGQQAAEHVQGAGGRRLANVLVRTFRSDQGTPR
jgi:site-specific DNA recombinase